MFWQGVYNGRVCSRDGREFADRRWIEHMGNKGLKQDVQNIMAEREKKNQWGGRTNPP